MPYCPNRLPLRIPFLLLGIFSLISLAGCASKPLTNALDQAQQAGASWETITGDGFEHLVISQIPEADVHALHIYIGGDGNAFHSRLKVSQDPTPKQHLALKLMFADGAPSAFIARPCYYTSGMGKQCNAALWTSDRYSPAVIHSMGAVVKELALRHPRAQITLVGYSGGGVIALLLAAELPRVGTIVSVASPLDTDAWVQLHAYTPLYNSLNPADIATWPTGLRQLHLRGGADKNVPPAVTERFKDKLQALGNPAEFRTLPGYDHHCCWLDTWGEIMKLQGQPQAH